MFTDCPFRALCTFYVICTHTHSRYCSHSSLATMERVWCGKFSQACAEKREGKQRSGSEKWVPCVEYWNSAPVLWPVKGIWLNVWGDVDMPELGWGESCCEGAGTYFKTRLFVLVKALRWQQHHWWFVMDTALKTGDWRVGLTHPPLVAPGGEGAGALGPWGQPLAQDLQSTRGSLKPCFLFQHCFS